MGNHLFRWKWIVAVLTACWLPVWLMAQDVSRDQVLKLLDEKPSQAISVIDSLLKVEHSDSARVWLYGRLTSAYMRRGQQQEALKSSIKALEAAKNNKLLIAGAGLDHAVLLHQLRFLKDAETYFKKVQPTIQELSFRQAVRWANNYGNLLSDLGKHKEALTIYSSGLQVAIRHNDSVLSAYFYHNQAVAHGFLNRVKESERNELLALEQLKCGRDKQLESQIRLSLASLYLDDSRPLLAKKQLDFVDPSTQKEGVAEFKIALLRNQAHFFQLTGKAKESFDYLTRALEMTDSLRTSQNELALADLQTKHEMAQQEQAATLASLAAEAATKDARNNKMLAWLLGGGALVFLLLLMALFRLYMLNKQHNQLLLKDKALLEQNNQVLLQENLMAQYQSLKDKLNPHFLFNMLSTLGGIMSHDVMKAHEFLQQFSQLFRLMLQVQEQPLVTLQSEMDIVNHYLKLMETRHDGGLIVSLSMEPESLTLQLPPFTIQLLIENAIKHNKVTQEMPLAISITSTLAGHVVVSNTIQPRPEPAEGLGLGWDIIRRRYKLVTDLEPVTNIQDQWYRVSLPLL